MVNPDYWRKKYPKEWPDEDGNLVKKIPFFGTLYQDEESRKLDSEYDVHSCSSRMVSSTLGDASHECFVAHLLGVCKAVGYFVGFEKTELGRYDSHEKAHFPIGRHFRLKKVHGIEVLFPTEALLKNQKVKKIES